MKALINPNNVTSELLATQIEEEQSRFFHYSFTNHYWNRNGSKRYNKGATQFYIPDRLTFAKTLVSNLFRLGRIVSQQSRLTIFGAVASVAALFYWEID